MNLQTHVRNDLWLAIQSNYVAGNYAGAILDTFHYLSKILREKSGADGDGSALVGQAFGGDAPRLRVNKLQTQTERDVQKGIESILRGMYQAIRNPRSHEDVTDVQATADSVIYFANYLFGFLDQAHEPFVLTEFLDRVFDSDFVKTQHYAELLVADVPANRRLDVLLALNERKLKGDIEALHLVFEQLLSSVATDQLKDYYAVISGELAGASKELVFRYAIHLTPVDQWPMIAEAPRLRTESRVVRDLALGAQTGATCTGGALATWAHGHLRKFSPQSGAARALAERLGASPEGRLYVATYFLQDLPAVVPKRGQGTMCVWHIAEGVRLGEAELRKELVSKIRSLPAEWQEMFAFQLADMTDTDIPEIRLSDGSPFLRDENPLVDPSDLPF